VLVVVIGGAPRLGDESNWRFDATRNDEFAPIVEKPWNCAVTLIIVRDSRTTDRICTMSERPATRINALSPHRRRLLQGLGALVAAGYVPAGIAQAAPSASQFTAMSRTLTGYVYADAQTANALLHALSTAVGASNLAKVANLASSVAPDQLDATLASAGLQHAAATIVTALYSGVVDTPKGPVVITYDQALGWQAVPWTKPNAVCGGVTDYWSTAPVKS
jgi:hypothetical protein